MVVGMVGAFSQCKKFMYMKKYILTGPLLLCHRQYDIIKFRHSRFGARTGISF